MSARQFVRGALFRKYVVLIVTLMGTVLAIGSAIDIYFTFEEHRSALAKLQKEQVNAAAARISLFVREIENQIGWMSHLGWSGPSTEQKELDALRLLRQVPAISELRLTDGQGRERLRISREAMDRIDSNADLSSDLRVTTAIAEKVYYGPVYFRRGTEPYMTLAVAGTRRDAGVAIAEVNLTHIWDVVSSIRAGRTGRAYVVDSQSRLIAHPDISLVLRNTDLSRLPQVRAARGGPIANEPEAARNLLGEGVVTAHARAEPLDWHVFVEVSDVEANQPLRAAIARSLLFTAAGLGIAIISALLLARHLVVPIRQLSAGAARIGKGTLEHRIAIGTGDELEELGDQFNRMAAQLQSSYASLEGKVEERTRELQVAVYAKSRFLAVASHDLRQPLHALNLLVAQLRSEPDAAERARLTLRIETALTNINELFNSLLDISRLDAGAQQVALSEFPVHDVLQRIESTFASAAFEKGLHFALVQTSVWVRSDPLLLERILLNIVSNALRYTQKGGVVVGCRRTAGTLRIDVYDTGAGIPADQHSAIFSEFYRGSSSAGAGGDGLGLGLAIVQRLCDLLQHPLALASTPGKGSRFSVSLPMADASARPKVARSLMPRSINRLVGRLVVVIDDDPLVLEGTRGLLQSWDCRVVAAPIADEAVENLRGEVPSLIISDFQLAGANTGIEAISILRRSFATEIPALLISGNLAPGIDDAARRHGLMLLHKPVQPMVLRAAISGLLPSREATDAHDLSGKTHP